MRLPGADIIMECLLEQGVDVVFGYPGGQVITLYDALYRYAGRIRHVLTAHEQGAAHAADGYARASGRVGVCIATSGPGATNLVTGIATAFMDSIPMVAITGNVPTTLLGKDSFQEIDIFGVTTPITKHNFIIKKIEDLAPTLRKAFQIAQSGRKGPVLVDIPKDVTVQTIDFEPMTAEANAQRALSLSEDALSQALALLESAQRPFVFAGGGVTLSGGADALRAFVRKLDAPVALSLMGIGCYPADADELTGMIGMHGTRASAIASKECDVLLAVGTRFSDRVVSKVARFAPDAKVIHIDIDDAEINKNVHAAIGLVGDAKAVLETLCAKLPQQGHAAWREYIRSIKRDYPLPETSAQTGLSPASLLRALKRAVGTEDAYIVTDVGQHQMWTAQHYDISRPGHLVTSGGLGTMGYGLGAAIGVKTARPDAPVVLVTGDGSFHMNMNELVTASTYHIPLVIVVMNNHVLGMVYQWQKMMFGKRYSQTVLERKTDYVLLAEALGCKGARIEDISQAEEVFRAALASGEPTVIDCRIDQEQNVLPLVPPGRSIHHQIMEYPLEEQP